MPTPRDKAWAVAITLARETHGFSAGDVRSVLAEQFDDPPSRKTVQNTLNAMAELGVIVRLGKRGRAAHYVEAD